MSRCRLSIVGLICGILIPRLANAYDTKSSTNGFCANISGMIQPTGRSPYLSQENLFVQVNLISPPTDPHRVLRDPLFGGKYMVWGPTNSFCGPLELRDESGALVKPRHPNITSASAYPSNFNLLQLINSWDKTHHYVIITSPILRPGQEWAQRTFFVSDYFKIKKSGNYTLTLWPKLYEQSLTQPDIFERVDLPPVAISFAWQKADPMPINTLYHCLPSTLICVGLAFYLYRRKRWLGCLLAALALVQLVTIFVIFQRLYLAALLQ